MASRTDTDGKNRLIHFLDLNEYGLDEVPDSARISAKAEVANYLENEVLRKLDAGVSPVKGEGRFKRLEADYSRREKSGSRTANLENEGDLKDSYFTRVGTQSFLEIGHTGNEVPKADGHNQISSKAQNWAKESKMPRRRYIPDTGQKYSDDITKEIKKIINQFKRVENDTANIDTLDDLDLFTIVGTETESTNIQSEAPTSSFITTNNLFNDDVIDLLLQDAQRRR